MIYLFNSGFRPLYAADVLKMLALPSGATVVHRYRCAGGESHVHPSLSKALAAVNGAPRVHSAADPLAMIGLVRPLDVLICFVERDRGYAYLPMRRGTLHSTWERDDRLFLRVLLGDFMAPSALAGDTVSKRIKDALNGDGPRLPSDPAQPTKDGCYAIVGDDVVSGCPDVVHGEKAWNAAVDSLSQSTVFAPTATRNVAYLRASLHAFGSTNEVTPTLAGAIELFDVRKNSAFELRLSYRCPGSTNRAESGEIALTSGESVQVLETGPIPINALSDEFAVPIAVRRYADERYTSLSVEARKISDPSAVSIMGPKLTLLLALREGPGFWLQVSIALLVFSLATLLAGASDQELAGVTFTSLPSAMAKIATVPRVLAALGQAAVLFWLVRLVGKKPL